MIPMKMNKPNVYFPRGIVIENKGTPYVSHVETITSLFITYHRFIEHWNVLHTKIFALHSEENFQVVHCLLVTREIIAILPVKEAPVVSISIICSALHSGPRLKIYWFEAKQYYFSMRRFLREQWFVEQGEQCFHSSFFLKNRKEEKSQKNEEKKGRRSRRPKGADKKNL